MCGMKVVAIAPREGNVDLDDLKAQKKQ